MLAEAARFRDDGEKHGLLHDIPARRLVNKYPCPSSPPEYLRLPTSPGPGPHPWSGTGGRGPRRSVGIVNPGLIGDCERRISAGQAGPQELHQILFAGERAAGTRRRGPARASAMRAVADEPAHAVSALAALAQRPGNAGRRLVESVRNEQESSPAGSGAVAARDDGRLVGACPEHRQPAVRAGTRPASSAFT
jgi:hypothetical protein